MKNCIYNLLAICLFVLCSMGTSAQTLDCNGVPDGPAVPGTPCNDGNSNTFNDVYQTDCSCAGTFICNTNAGIAQAPTTMGCLDGNNMGNLLINDYVIPPNAPNHAYLITNPDGLIVGVSYDGTYDFSTEYLGIPLSPGEYCFRGFAYDQIELNVITSNPVLQTLIPTSGGETLDEFVNLLSESPFGPMTPESLNEVMDNAGNFTGFPPCVHLAEQAHCVWVNHCNCSAGINVTTTATSTTINAGETIILAATYVDATSPVQTWWEPTDFLDDPNSMSPQANPAYSITYTFNVVDANGCVDSEPLEVMVNEAAGCATSGLVVDAYDDQTITQGDSTIISCFYTGGTPPYALTWLPSDAVSWPNNSQTWTSPLETTTYMAVVTDAAGCTASDEMTVFVEDPCEFELIILDIGEAAGCWGACNASVTFIIYGSEPEYELHLWDVGGEYDYIVPSNIPYTLNNVCSYDELFSVTSNGCTVEEWFFPEITNWLEATPLDAYVNFGETATISVNTIGGTLPYTYVWDNGVTTPNNSFPAGFGAYTVTVTDAMGCTASTTAHVYELGSCDGFLVEGGEDLYLPPGGEGQLNAYISSGGTPPFSYSWTPTTGLSDPGIPNPIVTQNRCRTNLLGGSNGCKRLRFGGFCSRLE